MLVDNLGGYYSSLILQALDLPPLASRAYLMPFTSTECDMYIFMFPRAADKRSSLIKTTSLKRRTDRDLEGTVNESYQQGECRNIYHNAST